MCNHGIQRIDVYTLSQRMQKKEQFLLLDVRTKEEIAICRLPGSVAMPTGSLVDYVKSMPDDMTIIIYCHHGIRSMLVARYLVGIGVDSHRLFNLEGGIDAYANLIDPSIVRY